MKRTFLCLLMAFCSAAAPLAAAQPNATEITVTGTGTVTLPPDLATINANVETNAPNAADAVSSNNQTYERVVAALVRSGVARGDIALSYYNVNYNPPPQVLPPAPTGERYGYTVTRGFAVKVRAIGKAGSVTDACIAAGASGINGISFGLADPHAARDEAIARAVADARTTAQALARTAALSLVAIKSIGIGGGSQGPVMLEAARMAAPTVLDQSNVSVVVTVTVVFLAKP